MSMTPSGSSGAVDIYTGFAAVNRGGDTATITITLRDMAGVPIATGAGALAKGGHIARFVQELGEVFPGFSLPSSFAESTHFGTLELMSDQPISVVALRLTKNQRDEMLMTTMPIANMTRPPSMSNLFFPQLANGGGYATAVFLMNTSNNTQSGTLRSYGSNGSPLEVTMSDGAHGTSFRYQIPPGGARVFQTDGRASETSVGWIELNPDSGNSTPSGVGLFEYSRNGVLITQSGVTAASPTIHARIYVDKSSGHDTGLALVNPGLTSTNVTLSAFNLDGSAVTTGSGAGGVFLPAHGHSSRFVTEHIPGLPEEFRGVIEIGSSSAFAVLTIRSLVNTRGDFLLTTFPVADMNTPAPTPIVFPQIADRGGYQTEFIFLGSGTAAALILDFRGNDGHPIPVGK